MDEESGEVWESCTIITTTPNAVMAQRHNRMPVILDEDAIAAWLEPDQDPAILQALLHSWRRVPTTGSPPTRGPR
jgi:putative SOS response-associated peptidase YedK